MAFKTAEAPDLEMAFALAALTRSKFKTVNVRYNAAFAGRCAGYQVICLPATVFNLSARSQEKDARRPVRDWYIFTVCTIVLVLLFQSGVTFPC